MNIKAVESIHDRTLMSKEYSSAYYFVTLSYKKEFVHMSIEAMACRVPIIVLPISGIEELIPEYNEVHFNGCLS